MKTINGLMYEKLKFSGGKGTINELLRNHLLSLGKGEVGQVWSVLSEGVHGWGERQEERQTYSLVNEEYIELEYTEPFSERVYLLGNDNVEGHTIFVTIEDVEESFFSVGMVGIDENNQWYTGSERMGFKSGSSAKYLVFDLSLESWVIGELGDHTIDLRNSGYKFVLSSKGTLPESFANVYVDVNFKAIPSKYFSLCEPEVEYFTEENIIRVSFSGSPQVGFVTL